MKVTIKDICRITGVSVATVSRVINGKSCVKEETRRMVMEAIEKYGFTPSAAARNLILEKTDTIGVIFHQISSGFYASVMAGIELEARGCGLHTLITFAHHTDPQRMFHYDMLDEARVDGLIVMDSTLTEETIEKLKAHKRPIVLIQRFSEDVEITTVSIDDKKAACMALQHLLSLGHRNILLITGAPETQDSNLRLEGCRLALEGYGMYLKDLPSIVGYYSSYEALKAFREYRDKEGLPRAVFAFNDDMALAVMKELRLTGVKVPEDVAVVGFDDVTASDFMGLTTMHVPMIELGHEAVKALFEQIKEPGKRGKHMVKEAVLVVRESCGGTVMEGHGRSGGEKR